MFDRQYIWYIHKYFILVFHPAKYLFNFPFFTSETLHFFVDFAPDVSQLSSQISKIWNIWELQEKMHEIFVIVEDCEDLEGDGSDASSN